MIQIVLMWLQVSLASMQTQVTPKSQACVCSSLLSQADCIAKIGCIWTYTTSTIASTNATATSLTTQGTCANSITPIVAATPPTYCLNVTNVTLCAQTVGCALLNNTCTIFTGCSAYVQTTNSACQAISTQCTTDGTRCVPPSTCSTYTTQALCSGNVATSGAKSCTWTANGASGTCADKVCSGAPATYLTSTQCNGWIAGCLTTGKGCATSLGACSSYTQTNGCIGMIGSDGPCTANTAAGSTVCRPLVCTDAATTLATNTACAAFLSGCVSTGKGCISALSACSSYTQTQGCTGLIGSDGACTANTTTGSTACRALACSDAPASTNTNPGCVSFLAGCVTTGQGCTNSLGSCSSYTGTTTTCASYVGTDGNCKGTSATAAACAARTCADAATTTNTNAACAAFQTGCVTTGAGCTSSLGLCSSYTGTNTTCAQYIGSDGNCTAPSSQTTAAACAVKVCTDAPNTSNTNSANTSNTNSACQAFSFQCVTNGAGCISQTTCETTLLAISCQGNTACASNQICLNRSQCANYINQSQCLLNQQQYLSGGTQYQRACTWSSGTCSNQVCTTLSTSLTTDAACTTGLAGCLTNGTGCLDVAAPCTDYKGTQTQCNAFKGLNGTQSCGNITGAAATANCIIKTCANANTGGTIASQANCASWLSGCNFDGKDNCTNSSCDKYYGVIATCKAVTTAVDGSNKPQIYYQPTVGATSTTACAIKLCTHAPNTLTSNNDCNNFLQGCITNGAGCVSSSYVFTETANDLDTCDIQKQFADVFKQQYDIICDCTQKKPPTGTASSKLWCQAFVDSAGNNCQYDTGPYCVVAVAGSCANFIPTTGTTDGEKALSCFKLKLDGSGTCGLATGGTVCSNSVCTQFTIPSTATTPAQKFDYCSAITTDSATYVSLCGLRLSTSTACSARACTDYGIGATDDASCDTYLTGCKFVLGGYCYTYAEACTGYVIPATFKSDLQKAQYCAAAKTNQPSTCTYQAATSTTNCSNSVPVCTDILIGTSNVLSSDQDKLAFCRASQKADAASCAYIYSAAATCAAIGACNTYPAIGVTDDGKQFYCSQLIDDASKACVFTTGSSSCVVPSATICATLATFGATATLKQAVCNAYTLTNKCGYVSTSTANVCSDATCADVASTVANQTFCPAYLSTCVYDGLNCVTKVAICSTYDAQTVGSGAAVNCANLTDTIGNKCTFVAGATKCAARACPDTIASPSAANCAAYLSTCVFNGSACVAAQPDCSRYTPQGANDAAKAAICNSLYNASELSKCTFITRSNACINSGACNTYNLPAASQNAALGQPACALTQDNTGALCAFDSTTPTKCAARTCALAIFANTDADCNTWLSGCDQNPGGSTCSSVVCYSAPNTAITNSACGIFRKGCLTNGAGCVEPTVACSGYKGTQTTCNGFIGNSIPCTNNSTSAAGDACLDRTCALNTTAKSDSDCKTWFQTCVWKGIIGCVNPQPCTSFTGTCDSCPTFTAIDGPCYGKGTVATPAACASNNSNCTGAPLSYNTDAQCKTWGSACMTNGFGCILASNATCSSIITPHACSLYKSTAGLYCDLAKQCKTKPSTCGALTTASDCISTLLAGQTKYTCVWDAFTTTCVPLICNLLPVTLTTDNSCKAVISTCTTNGAGCINKGACSTYSKLACRSAATTDWEKACIWSNSNCRPIQCTDNTTATSDAACNTYLEGCRTTGSGCASIITCSTFTSAQFCLFDSSGFPCLWYQASADAPKACLSYSKCTDIIQTSHASCQAVSPLCATNGTNCIAITGCSNTVLQASCIVGTDGNCGWLPAVGNTDASCVLFTNCSAANGTTTQQCQVWGSACVSNGITCLSKSTCSSYTTQIACGNAGTDGICYWVVSTSTATTGTCRLQQCSDATTNTSTHKGCVEYQAETVCTTSGTDCIPQAKCSSYQVQDGCVQGTDGICFWATTKTNSTIVKNQSVCRLKQCADSFLTSSASCASAIVGVKCVSNGFNCIQKSTCQLYTSREACLGGGSDGPCAFMPGINTTTPNVGTCVLFSQCSNANSDQIACDSRSDTCYFNQTTTNGTLSSSCSTHTCASKELGSICQPVPSWDLSTYQICIFDGINCDAGNPSQLRALTCYTNSVGTYSWNVNTKTCTVCISSTNTTNNPINSTTYGFFISLTLQIFLLN